MARHSAAIGLDVAGCGGLQRFRDCHRQKRLRPEVEQFSHITNAVLLFEFIKPNGAKPLKFQIYALGVAPRLGPLLKRMELVFALRHALRMCRRV